MKRIMILMFSILCLTACNDNDNDPSIERPNPPAQITLSIPDATVVNTYSTATNEECMIDTLWVFVFDGATGAKKWVDIITGDRIVNNGQAAQILPQLKHEPATGDTVVLIANIGAARIDTSSYITCANINQYIRASDADLYPHLGNPFLPIIYDLRRFRLPMYGEMVWSPMAGYTCTMIRAVAKIQVQLAPGYYDATGNFNAETVTWGLAAGAPSGYLKPTSLLNGIPSALRYPGSIIFSVLQREDVWDNPFARISGGPACYIPEYPSSTNDWAGNSIMDNEFDPNRVHLVLMKATTLLDDSVRYYRLDFFDHLTGKFLDIKRNHNYLFTIRAVRSEGYYNQALDGGYSSGMYLPRIDYYGSNLEYTIKITDGARAITSNGQYAIVTNVDTIKLPAGAVTVPSAALFRYEDPKGFVDKVDTTTSISVLPVNWILVENASGGTMTVTPHGRYLPTTSTIIFNHSAPWFYTREKLITPTNRPLDVTVDAGFVSGTVVFFLGNIEHRVHVVRE